MHYNTTRETGAKLKGFGVKTEGQDRIILGYFKAAKVLSPAEVHMIAEHDGYHWLLTSVRRSITTLTKAKLLSKTADKVEGAHGRGEHIWELREEK